MIYHDGWYYLLATHGSCCRGADSGYNIRVGRSRKVTGPFLDNMGVDMIQGGGKLFIGSGGRVIGPGHFGLLDLGDGVQKFSMHWEADLDRGGASVLDIRPLLWKDGWPVAGENLKEGTYEIESVRTGTALELAVEGVPVGGRRGRGGAAAGGPAGRGRRSAGGEALRPGSGLFAGTGSRFRRRMSRRFRRTGPRATSTSAWPTTCARPSRSGRLRASPTPAAIPARPISRSRSPARIARWRPPTDGELVALPAFTGAPEQLWRIDQLTDGTWRIMPKSVRIPRSRSLSRPSAAVPRRWRSSIPRATSNAGCSRRHEDSIRTDY